MGSRESGRKKRRHRRISSKIWGQPRWAVLSTFGLVVLVLGGIFTYTYVSDTQASEAARNQPVPTREPIPTVTAPPVAAFIGDSYTTGAGASAPELRFSSLVAADQGWVEVNVGQGGTGFVTNADQDPVRARSACGKDYCPSYAEVIPLVQEKNPEIVVVSGGRNSVSTEPDRLAESITGFMAALRQAVPDAQIIVTSPIWDDDAEPESIAAIRDLVREASATIGATYLDIGEPLAGRPETVGADGVHPNDVGYKAIADALIAAMAS